MDTHKWIYDKSLKAGVIAEYLKYFEKFPDKIKDFSAVDSMNDKFLPTSECCIFSSFRNDFKQRRKRFSNL